MIIWAVVYGLLSILLGLVITKVFKTPSWVTPAIAFNNTTSLPLLLVQSLAATKLLDTLDSSGSGVARANSYFLINAMVGNSLTFALGEYFCAVVGRSYGRDRWQAKDSCVSHSCC